MMTLALAHPVVVGRHTVHGRALFVRGKVGGKSCLGPLTVASVVGKNSHSQVPASRPEAILQALKAAADKAAAAVAVLGLCSAQALAQDVAPAAGVTVLSADPNIHTVQEVLLDVWREVDERFVDAARAPVDWQRAKQARKEPCLFYCQPACGRRSHTCTAVRTRQIFCANSFLYG